MERGRVGRKRGREMGGLVCREHGRCTFSVWMCQGALVRCCEEHSRAPLAGILLVCVLAWRVSAAIS